MATNFEETENGGEPPADAVAEAIPGAEESIQPADSAEPTSGAEPLPPRIDGGENVEEVLGEVSKLFGQMAGGVSLPLDPADEINEDLNDLTAAGAPAAKSAVPHEPSHEMKLGTAADLFRSSPAEPPETPVEAGQSGEASESVDDPERSDVERGDAGSNVPANVPAAKTQAALSRTAAAKKALRGQLDRLPAWSRLPAAAALALLMGLLVGAGLTRSRVREIAAPVAKETPAAQKAALQKDAEGPGESTTKLAALEEQLQQALAERGAAQRERQKAVAELKFLEAQAQSGTQSKRVEAEREQAARLKAELTAHGAAQEIRRLELGTYNVQLARVRETWRHNPGLALVLLEDAERCPPRLRDFTWGYFHGRAQNDHATLVGHVGRVNAVAWSPDGKQIASCGQDGLLKFWDAGIGKETASLVAHGGGALALAFSERGELLATAGADGTLKLWDVASRKLTGTFFGHLGTVRGVAMAPDVSSLFSAGEDGTVRFWDVVSRRATATRWGRPHSREPVADDPMQFVRSIACSPDGLLVAAGTDKTVRIWETGGAAEKTILSVPEGPVTALAFSPQGTTLAAGTDGAIHRFDVESSVPRSSPIAVKGRVNALRYSADGRLLAAATDQGGLLFRGPFDRPLQEPWRLAGHVGEVAGIAVAPNGETVVTSGDDGTLRLWSATSGTVDKIEPDAVFRSSQPAVSVAYSPDGKTFAAAGSDSITLWNVRDGVEKATLTNRSGVMTQIAFSPDGNRLASASKDWPVLLWDLASQRVTAALNGHTGSVNTINFSSDGSFLLSGSDDATLRTWDAVTGREQSALSGHAAAVLCTVLSPDGKLAASGGADHSVRLWDLRAKRPVATLAGHQGPVVSLGFSPDGRSLASVESSLAPAAPGAQAKHRPIRLWRLPKGETAREFGAAGTSVRGIVFSPDGKTLATSADDGVTLWDAETCEMRETLHFPSAGPLAPLVFSPDGLTLAAGGQSAVVFWTAAQFAGRP